MQQEEIDNLKVFRDNNQVDIEQVLETHISWIVLTDLYAYKIKKPLKTSFLDYSTKEKRKLFCEKEVVLNQRLTEGIYLKTVPIFFQNNVATIGGPAGNIVDHAVLMKKMNRFHQMDILLKEGKVSLTDIENIAFKVAEFHKKARVVTFNINKDQLKRDFNDINTIAPLIQKCFNSSYIKDIEATCSSSDAYLDNNFAIFQKRIKEGFFKDCHGDLHAKNIIIEKPPLIFDCIEFNDSFRYIDVLNEIAFCCMELEIADEEELSNHFLKKYIKFTGFEFNPLYENLLQYYKMYKANIRAKVTGLELIENYDSLLNKAQVKALKTYLDKMKVYKDLLKVV